uniref:Transcription initiation factor IIA subunit 2 n=2 Tax=Panagrolaimus sp. JU765 TaxID=591449 RepID=A0AC34Q2Q2_9BILA
MAYQIYRSSTLGEALEHVLAEYQNDGTLPSNLVNRMMNIFDHSFARTLKTRVKTKYAFQSQKLRTYRFCDNVWTFVLQDVHFRDQIYKTTLNIPDVRIVACDSLEKS